MMNDPLQLDEKPAPMPDHPASYPKRILLAVTGKTPQIVTETLWALAMDSEQPFVPTQIRLLTTEEGRRHAVEKLLNPESGAFHALCRDWKLGPIDFDAACIQVLSREGQPVEDIVSPHDNEITADQICAWVKEATRDPQSAVHVSLAGGRKTMGYYAGYALSLFGRDQDRLSHVLVDERYERMREFYYPTPEPCTLFSPDGKLSADASAARVHLARIPFVRLSHFLSPGVRAGQASFTETVAETQKALAVPELRLDYDRCDLVCGGRRVHLPPSLFALYAWMARRRIERGEAAGVTYTARSRWDRDCEELNFHYEHACSGSETRIDKFRKRLANGLRKAQLEQGVTKINAELNRQMGAYRFAEPYQGV
jgi:CRISPR-associated protein (TIGR02584 family)